MKVNPVRLIEMTGVHLYLFILVDDSIDILNI